MTYASTATGDRAHIWDPESDPQDRAYCSVIAPHPYSASEEDIREAERSLCENCKEARRKRPR